MELPMVCTQNASLQSLQGRRVADSILVAAIVERII